MADFNKQKFADYLVKNVSAHAFGEGKCAQHVRQALAAAGLKPHVWPVPAKDWGPTLLTLGFISIPADSYTPLLGDIVVIQATKEDKNGHIAGYDGRNWVSDFVQRDLWPGPHYRAETPSYKIYRRVAP